mgnify:CR=1 FL=1
MFEEILQGLEAQGQLEGFRSVSDTLLVAMDGTEYFSSTQLCCPQCSTRTLRSGDTQYFHSVVTPVIVCPGQNHVIPLVPEFVRPQDGHDKQDCENAAAKRWFSQHGERFSRGIDLPTVIVKRWTGTVEETWTSRYLNGVPLRDGEDALWVNWCELTVSRPDGRVTYHNAFVTRYLITDDTVTEIVQAGRTRWKVENKNNNTLKTKGYNLEHNFGHGQQHLASLLATLNIVSLSTGAPVRRFEFAIANCKGSAPTRSAAGICPSTST